MFDSMAAVQAALASPEGRPRLLICRTSPTEVTLLTDHTEDGLASVTSPPTAPPCFIAPEPQRAWGQCRVVTTVQSCGRGGAHGHIQLMPTSLEWSPNLAMLGMSTG